VPPSRAPSDTPWPPELAPSTVTLDAPVDGPFESATAFGIGASSDTASVSVLAPVCTANDTTADAAPATTPGPLLAMELSETHWLASLPLPATRTASL
jgi:hypothetical protein